MAFNAVLNSISVISQWPMHLSMLSWSSFNQFSAQYSFQASGCFPTSPLSKDWTAVKKDRILSQRLSSILGKNIARAGDRTSDLLFLSLQGYRLSFGAWQVELKLESFFCLFVFFLFSKHLESGLV